MRASIAIIMSVLLSSVASAKHPTTTLPRHVRAAVVPIPDQTTLMRQATPGQRQATVQDRLNALPSVDRVPPPR
jgi:hypothetical protein